MFVARMEATSEGHRKLVLEGARAFASRAAPLLVDTHSHLWDLNPRPLAY